MNSNELRRFFSKVQKDESGCWLWTGCLDEGGYGRFHLKREGFGNQVRSHIASYEHFVKPRTKGLTLDHLCRVRNCCNPKHLEEVTQAINNDRGMAPTTIAKLTNKCIRGHEFTKENTLQTNGHRTCRICSRSNNRARYKWRWENEPGFREKLNLKTKTNRHKRRQQIENQKK